VIRDFIGAGEVQVYWDAGVLLVHTGAGIVQVYRETCKDIQ
jgi:hypothetical protein